MGSSPPPSSSPRAFLTLPLKLILATVVLVVAAVGAAALFSLRTLESLAETETQTRRTAGQTEIRDQAQRLAVKTARSAALPLAEGNFTYLDSLVHDTIEGDPRIQWLLIADAGSNRIVARTDGAPAGKSSGGAAVDPAKTQLLADDLVAKVAASDDVAVRQDSATAFTMGIRVKAGDQVVGQLRLGVTTRALEDELQASITSARKRADEAKNHLFVIAAIIVAAGIVLGAWEGLRITRPIQALSTQAGRIAGGDFDHRVSVRSRDEIGQLAQSFNFMAERLGLLMRATAEKASMDREMALARDVQRAMIPPEEVIPHGPLRVLGFCESASVCGGDFWTLRKLPGDRLLVVVGDVTGHGMSSAMVAAAARGAVEALTVAGDRTLTPEEVLSAMDRAVRSVAHNQLLMTAFAALIDARHGTMDFANAGHNFPYVVTADAGTGDFSDVHVLAVRGNPLGATDPLIQSGRRDLVARRHPHRLHRRRGRPRRRRGQALRRSPPASAACATARAWRATTAWSACATRS